MRLSRAVVTLSGHLDSAVPDDVHARQIPAVTPVARERVQGIPIRALALNLQRHCGSVAHRIVDARYNRPPFDLSQSGLHPRCGSIRPVA